MDGRLGLPANTVLNGDYRIERVVGSGGFGITYEAEDLALGNVVAVKEYYPRDFGTRDPAMGVRPKSEQDRPTFDWGRSKFLQEARTLVCFEHPSIVRVTRVFEANSTAYMVMQFEQGQSFEAWLSGLGRLPTQKELDSIVAPLLDALQMMHEAEFLHRDIAADNIVVRRDGSPVLIDFGSARRAVAQMTKAPMGVVKAGYSPFEQYSADTRLQGPWSDLYAFGATLYRAVTGRPPEDAASRIDKDSMRSASQAARHGRYRGDFLGAIDACLKIRHADRPQSVARLRPMLLGRGASSDVEHSVEPKLANKPPNKASIRDVPAHPQRPVQAPEAQRAVHRVRRRPVASRWLAGAAALTAIFGVAYGAYDFAHWYPRTDVGVVRYAAIDRHVQVDGGAATKKTEETARTMTTDLNAEQRASYVKRIQTILKHKRCYDGPINGSSEEAQKGLDRYLNKVGPKTKAPPFRMQVANATAGDFDSWLLAVEAIKGAGCAPAAKPKAKASAQSERDDEPPPRAQRNNPRQLYPSLEDW